MKKLVAFSAFSIISLAISFQSGEILAAKLARLHGWQEPSSEVAQKPRELTVKTVREMISSAKSLSTRLSPRADTDWLSFVRANSYVMLARSVSNRSDTDWIS